VQVPATAESRWPAKPTPVVASHLFGVATSQCGAEIATPLGLLCLWAKAKGRPPGRTAAEYGLAMTAADISAAGLRQPAGEPLRVSAFMHACTGHGVSCNDRGASGVGSLAPGIAEV